jgi:hypothetical protein
MSKVCREFDIEERLIDFFGYDLQTKLFNEHNGINVLASFIIV